MAATNDVINCNKCKKEIEIEDDKFLFCTNKDCKKCFHAQCVNLSDLKYKKYAKEKHKVWFCENCVNLETEKIQIRHSITNTSEITAGVTHSIKY